MEDIMNTNQRKAAALAEVLQSKSVALPVYVRFQTASQMTTVPVVSISVSEQGVTVQHSEGQNTSSLSYMWSDLTDIVAFCDANRKPIFLHDFAAEIGAYEEEKLEEQQMVATEVTRQHAAIWDIAHGKRARSWSRDGVSEARGKNSSSQTGCGEASDSTIEIDHSDADKLAA
jgi:hypothetical protein